MTIKSIFLKKIEKFLAENDVKECLSFEKLVDIFPDFADFLALEKERISKMAEFDLSFEVEKGMIAGADEAGRGPLAGPVCGACVRFFEYPFIPFLNDSKKMTERERIVAEKFILSSNASTAVSFVSNVEIDEINILNASLKAMKTSFENISPTPQLLLVDGNRQIKNFENRQICVVKGDSKSFSIASASVLAKNSRDRIMVEYSKEYPEYGFDVNKGYPVKKHIEAIEKFGRSKIHRVTFMK